MNKTRFLDSTGYHMKYKVGDRVKIVSKRCEYFGEDTNQDKYCGTMATITRADYHNGDYSILEDSHEQGGI